MEKLKDLVRAIFNLLHLDLTKNLKYDRLTIQIMKKVIKPKSNCIDIGCHKGEILSKINHLAPKGKHFAFEPIPYFYNILKKKFSNIATIYPYALSDSSGNTSFQYVKNAPAYSGLKKRKYAIENPDIEEINVEIKKLDDLIDNSIQIDFVKIDVEGAEFGVFKGAKNIFKKSKPIIVFEFGLGASDFYNTSPIEFYNFITNELGLKISTLENWLKSSSSMTINEFDTCFNKNIEYYFIAHP